MRGFMVNCHLGLGYILWGRVRIEYIHHLCNSDYLLARIILYIAKFVLLDSSNVFKGMRVQYDVP